MKRRKIDIKKENRGVGVIKERRNKQIWKRMKNARK